MACVCTDNMCSKPENQIDVENKVKGTTCDMIKKSQDHSNHISYEIVNPTPQMIEFVKKQQTIKAEYRKQICETK